MKNREEELLEALRASLTEQQQHDLDAILEDGDPDIQEEINLAYAVKNDLFKIYRDVDDLHDIGVEYVQQEYPDLDEIVFSNIDFEGVEMELSGRLTAEGYIFNPKDGVPDIYNGSNAEELLRELMQKQEQEQTQGMEISM